MATNIIPINSVNIKTFGFASIFDFAAKTLVFDISGLTVFNTGGEESVLGICFEVRDPSGVIINAIDFSAPAIDPSDAQTYSLNLLSGFAMFGFYTITGIIRDADNKDYQVRFNIEIKQPCDFHQGYSPLNVDLSANCNIPEISVFDKTNYSYYQHAAVSMTKIGTLFYPKGTLSDLAFTSTPFKINGSGKVFTGRYTLNALSVASYDIGNNVIVKVSYKATGFEKTVNCNGQLANLVCCISDLYDQVVRDPASSNSAGIKQRLNQASYAIMVAQIKERAGEDVSRYVKEISEILNCDCNCGPENIEPRAIIGGNILADNVAIIGSNAADVSHTQSGSTVTYLIDVKNVVAINAIDDLAFNINKVETQNTITYAFSINYNIFAASILNAIEGDEELLDLLKNLVGQQVNEISLEGLDGGCVVSIESCNYSLIEANNVQKKILSITIGGQVFNAPANLLITSVSTVQTWLNSLNKGTFTVNLDGTSNTIVIASSANPNVITELALLAAGDNIIRLFSRVCIGLVDLLNAIITYLCEMTTLQIEFGVAGQTIQTFNSGTHQFVSENLPVDILLSELLKKMLVTQAALITNITSIALTCAGLKNLFTTNTEAPNAADGIYGLKGNICAKYTFDEIAAIVLQKIADSGDLSSDLCGIASACMPSVCGVVTSLSAVFSGGNLTINANDIDPSTSLQIRYRVADSGLSYTTTTKTSTDFPVVITGLTTGRYEVGVRKLCTNGAYSDWATAFTSGCAVPVGFTAAKSHLIGVNQFNCTASLTGSQTKVDVQVTDPNNGVTVNTYDLGGQTGSFSIPIAIPTLYGTYQLRARAVCDNNEPRYVSEYLAPINVINASPTPGDSNFLGNIGNGMTIVSITNGTATGVPSVFNTTPFTGSRSGYTPKLTAGTITVVLSGTPSPATQLNLVKGIGDIQDSVLITGAGSYTLDNPADINFPDAITVTNLNLV